MANKVYPGVYNSNIQSIGPGVNSGGGSIVVSAWPMNEGSGLTLHDTSINANNITLANSSSVTWTSTPGLPGVTPVWNGTGPEGVAASSSATNFTGTTPFSVSLWMHPNNTSGAALVGSMDSAGGSFQGWEVTYNGSPATISFFINNQLSPGINSIQVGGALTVSGAGIHNVVITYDGSQTAAGVKMYIDSVLDTLTVTHNTLSATAANGLPMRVAERDDGTARFTGPMAYVEIWNIVLSAATIAANFALGPGIY